MQDFYLSYYIMTCLGNANLLLQKATYKNNCRINAISTVLQNHSHSYHQSITHNELHTFGIPSFHAKH